MTINATIWAYRSGTIFRLAAALLLAGGGSPAAAEVAGRFQFVHGDVRVQSANGHTTLATKGSELAEGDLVTTGPGAQAHLRMVDEGFIALRPQTQLRVSAYRYRAVDGKAAEESGVLELLRGGFRTLTGLIGKTNKSAYRINTPSATIGIRGTDHEPLVILPPGPGEVPLGEPGTYDKVNAGGTRLETAGGRVDIEPNQVGFAPPGGSPPVRLPDIPAFMRSSPAATSERDTRRDARDEPANRRAREAAIQPGGAAAAEESASLAPQRLAPLPPLVEGTLDPRQPGTGALTPAALGAGIAGGYLRADGKPENGAGVIGIGGIAALVDAHGNLAVVSGDQFSYTRGEAPLAQEGSALVSGDVVRWGVYAGGAVFDSGHAGTVPAFHFMGGSRMTGNVNLLQALSAIPAGFITYNTVAGYTKPITESGAMGGSVNSLSIRIGQLSGVPQLQQYNLGLTDAHGRTWSATLPNAMSLSAFRDGGTGSTLSATCSGCGTGSGSGHTSGVVIGNPLPLGVITSYGLQAGSAGVTGSVLVKP